MRRVLIAVAIVGAWAGVATAGGPTRKIEIESDPPGAKVYLNDIGDGALCDATPCTIDAPVGETPIILQLAGYESLIDQIDVPKKASKKPVFKFKLKSAIGTLVIDNPAAKGASVRVDGEDKGKVPVRAEVDAGSHIVSVTLGGKTLFEDAVTVDTGQELAISLKGASKGGGSSPGDGDGDGGDDGDAGGGSGSGSDHGSAITKAADGGPHERFITGSVAIDVGFRRFQYVAPKGMLNPTEGEDGQVLVGPAVELWPAELFHFGHLRGLSLFLRMQFPVNHQEVTQKMGGMDVAIGARTTWASFEASVRHRWMIGDAAAVEVNGGFVRDLLGFDTQSDAALMSVPSADYRSIRIGARASLVAGSFEPYLSVENRIVLSGGDLPSRFDTAHATGLRGALGANLLAGPFAVRAEASILSYSWTFTYDPISGKPEADGATDRVYGISLMAGYQY